MLKLVRNPADFSTQTFDILIIGGGINGAACAYDAALRGLSVALLEAQDFGSAASAGCFKIVHGGLRYLQHLNFSRLRESVREQQTLRRIAPHLVHPLPFLVPTYGYGMRGNEVLSCGLTLYELLSRDRNKGVPETHHLPNHRFLSPEECLHIAPGLKPQGLRGGLVYYDAQMSNCDRLTLAVLQSAALAGAKICNYIEASGFEMEGDEIRSVEVKDRLTGQTQKLTAKLVVNAAGPWCPLVQDFLKPESAKKPLYYSKGVQLVCKQFVSDYALAIESKEKDPEARLSRGARSYFAHPWRGYTLLGTADVLHRGSPETYRISKDEVRELLENAAEMYKDSSLRIENVVHAFGGLRPLPEEMLSKINSGYSPTDTDAQVSLKEEIIDHGESSRTNRASNLVSLIGVKYTTFRAFAEEVVDLCVRKLDAKVSACETEQRPLYGASLSGYQSMLETTQAAKPSVEFPVIQHLVQNYGEHAQEVLAIAENRKELLQPLSETTSTLGAELLFAARYEMVSSLQDVVMRRTGLGTVGYPGSAVLARAAAIVSEDLGWSASKVSEEIEATRAEFPLVPQDGS